PFLVAFGGGLLFFDICGRIVRPFSLRGFEYVMAGLQWYLTHIFLICGTRFTVERSTQIEPHTGYAIVSNHQSLLDIVMIGGYLFTNFPKYVAKKELGRGIPSVSLNLRWGGNALIDRGDRSQAFRTIREMAARAQERGVSVVIFPEGTRSRDGRLKEFKRGGMVMMLKAADRLPVVPTTVSGSWALAQDNLMPVPFGRRVTIRFGDPIPRSDDEDVDELVDRVEAAIRSNVEDLDPAG
ncbi:MAG: lysophospholipid acyltransferase family protein, partial [Halobacteriales archaeon]|nr:lysophospholipid acyltransferase family protein [Halobacteriales archaeon]